jgi:hypothetical protein
LALEQSDPWVPLRFTHGYYGCADPRHVATTFFKPLLSAKRQTEGARELDSAWRFAL